jgi:hypothetical protein
MDVVEVVVVVVVLVVVEVCVTVGHQDNNISAPHPTILQLICTVSSLEHGTHTVHMLQYLEIQPPPCEADYDSFSARDLSSWPC